MNFYPFHIGDYASATRHLSIIEDGAYRRLLDLYYSREKPLPNSLDEVCRLVSARDKQEKAAVETVLREFFIASEDGWKHTRCDSEIAVFNDKRTKAVRSAKARWQSSESHTERNANAMRTHTERIPDAVPTQCEGNATKTNTKNSVPNGTGQRALSAVDPRAENPSPQDPGDDESDPVKQLFDLGVKIFIEGGSSDRNARSAVGRMRSTVGDAETMRILIAARDTTDPIAFAMKAIAPKPRRVQLC